MLSITTVRQGWTLLPFSAEKSRTEREQKIASRTKRGLDSRYDLEHLLQLTILGMVGNGDYYQVLFPAGWTWQEFGLFETRFYHNGQLRIVQTAEPGGKPYVQFHTQ